MAPACSQHISFFREGNLIHAVPLYEFWNIEATRLAEGDF
jgi:hypothetical protein